MSVNAQRNPDVTESVLLALAAKIREIPSVEPLTAALAALLQEVEDITTWDLRFALQIEGATGAWLDLFGAIAGEPRGGRGDEEYRRSITARVQINASQGERERLIRIAQLLTSANAVQISTAYPAGYTMLIATPDDLDAAQLSRVRRALEDATAAGVIVDLVHSTGDLDAVFRFDASPMPALGDPGDGMGRSF